MNKLFSLLFIFLLFGCGGASEEDQDNTSTDETVESTDTEENNIPYESVVKIEDSSKDSIVVELIGEEANPYLGESAGKVDVTIDVYDDLEFEQEDLLNCLKEVDFNADNYSDGLYFQCIIEKSKVDINVMSNWVERTDLESGQEVVSYRIMIETVVLF